MIQNIPVIEDQGMIGSIGRISFNLMTYKNILYLLCYRVDDDGESNRKDKRKTTTHENETRSSRHYEKEGGSLKSHDQDSRLNNSENGSRSSKGPNETSHSIRNLGQSSNQERPSSDSEMRRNQRIIKSDEDSSSIVSDMHGMNLSKHSENKALLQAEEKSANEATQVPKSASKKKFGSKMRSIVNAVKTAQRLEVGFFCHILALT